MKTGGSEACSKQTQFCNHPQILFMWFFFFFLSFFFFYFHSNLPMTFCAMWQMQNKCFISSHTRVKSFKLRRYCMFLEMFKRIFQWKIIIIKERRDNYGSKQVSLLAADQLDTLHLTVFQRLSLVSTLSLYIYCFSFFFFSLL